MKQATFLDAAADAPLNRFADPAPLEVCPKCGTTKYRDRVIHGGRSQMRECIRCGYSMGIPLWYGEPAPTQHVAPNREPSAIGGHNGRLP